MEPFTNTRYQRLKVHDPENAIVLPNLFDDVFLEEFPDFICQICLSFVSNPVACGTCDAMFCLKCIDSYSQYSYTCPSRCKLSVRPVNRILRNLINQVRVKCLFFFKGCMELLWFDIYEQHINECEYGPHACLGKDCNFVDIKSKVINHCKQCDCIFPSDDMEEEVQEIETVTILPKIPCQYCKVGFRRGLLPIHTYLCPQQMLICKSCNVKMNLNELRRHQKNNQCLINQLQSQISHLQEKVSYSENQITILKNELQSANKRAVGPGKFDNHESNSIKSHIIPTGSINKNKSLYIKENIPENAMIKEISQMSFQNVKVGSRLISLHKITEDKILFATEDNDIEIQGLYDSSSFKIKFHSHELDDKKEEISCIKTITLSNGSELESTIYLFIGTVKGAYFLYQLYNKNTAIKLITQGKLTISSITCVEVINFAEGSPNFLLAIGTSRHNAYIFNPFTTEIISILLHENKEILSISFFDEFQILVTTTKDPSLRLWETFDDFPLKDTIKGHGDWIWCSVKLSFKFEEGRRDLLATGSGDKSVILWEFEKDKILNKKLTIVGHKNSVTCLSGLSIHSKNILLSGSYDGVIKIYLIDKVGTDHFEKSLFSIFNLDEHIQSILIIDPYEEYRKRTSQEYVKTISLIASSEGSNMFLTQLQVIFEQ